MLIPQCMASSSKKLFVLFKIHEHTASGLYIVIVINSANWVKKILIKFYYDISIMTICFHMFCIK